ncbi:DNA-binding transcriptional MerR regulator [Natronobacillus azotifigens]|uniref:DUF1836 domain-containing protein n=1 Tax=Natronobacillus azotifigens TaxID=472978 RepID=A0A9J6RG11_9BACI|nr:DUF1836 domain-containing protein [Natronobacillus azotifigens]MCZ0704366.1 DUF1836 domain-containing protein [Natronobacillus azotifigens]
MDNLQEIIASMSLDKKINRSDIPTIDLYMDQVTQLFERTYQDCKRNETDKVLTKTMINNYAKGKLMFPIRNKKYTEEHIMLIQFIYQLKGALSINDVRILLTKLNAHIEAESDDINLQEIYDQYAKLMENQPVDFTKAVQTLADKVEQATEVVDSKEAQYIEQLFMITSLVNYSNMYRKLAEKLVDGLYPNPNQNKKEEK